MPKDILVNGEVIVVVISFIKDKECVVPLGREVTMRSKLQSAWRCFSRKECLC